MCDVLYKNVLVIPRYILQIFESIQEIRSFQQNMQIQLESLSENEFRRLNHLLE